MIRRFKWIVVAPRLVSKNVGPCAVTDSGEHDLHEGESFLFAFFQNRPRVLQAEFAEELPLGRAQPENRLALLVDEISSVLTHLDGIHRYRGVCEDRQSEQRPCPETSDRRCFHPSLRATLSLAHALPSSAFGTFSRPTGEGGRWRGNTLHLHARVVEARSAADLVDMLWTERRRCLAVP